MKFRFSGGLIFLILTSFLLACQKEKIVRYYNDNREDTVIVDFRDEFVGVYNCSKLCTFFIISTPGVDTTFNGNIVVNVTKDLNSDALIIGNDTVWIDSTGNYTGYYNPPAYKNYSVSFFNDSIHISTFSGELGGGTTCNTKGYK